MASAFAPTWTTDYPYPARLARFKKGHCFNLNTGTSLAGAVAKLTDAKMQAMRDSGIDHVRHMFTIEEATGASSRNNPSISADAKACIRFVKQRMTDYRIGTITQVVSGNWSAQSPYGCYQDLHGDNADAGRWTLDNYIRYINNLWDCLPACATPENTMIGLGNEMGGGVTNRSTAAYNTMLASIVPAVRAHVGPLVTLMYDLYPTAAMDHFNFGGTTLAVPPDPVKNLIACTHAYYPQPWALDQGNNDATASGMKYIFGIPWGITRAEYLTWLTNLAPPGGAAGAAQRQWQIDNINTNVDALGFTTAAIDAKMATLINTWAVPNRAALHCSEMGGGPFTSTQFTLAAADAHAFMGSVITTCNKYGLGHGFFQDLDKESGGGPSYVPAKLLWE